MRTSQTRDDTKPILLAPTGMQASMRRIGALLRRYVYLLKSSSVRIVELLSLIHISEPTRRNQSSRMPSSA